jgi:hypothetical protein
MSANGGDDGHPPWDKPGAVRGDCKPHRGGWLQLLAWASLAGGAVPFALTVLAVMLPGMTVQLLPGMTVELLLRAVSAAIVTVAPPVAVVARILASRDIEKMRAGLMDPAGKGPALAARFVSLLGLALGLLAAIAVLGTFGLDFTFYAAAVGAVFLFLVVAART